MKPFVRIKKINGIEYLYEITPYYDPETKIIRQHSKYLGKNVNGKPERVRDKLPRRTYSYGEFLPSLQIIKDLKIEEILSKYLPEKDVKTILTLAQNRVVKPLALYHISSWNEGTILSKLYGELPLSSQSLSNLLNKIGNSDQPFEFSRNLIQNVSTSSSLIYDITSLSSYSDLINLLEYGYNRDGLNVPQVNLSVIMDKTLGIPLMYDLYPGSIVDVSALKNTIKKVKDIGITDFNLVLDRGFFSIPNIADLISNGLSFVIPAPFTVKAVKQLLSNIHSELEDANLLRMYNGEPIFVMPVTLDIGDMSIKGYSFYSQKKEQDERELFYRKLYDVVERLRKVSLKKWMVPQDVVEEIAGKFYSYIDWKVVNQGFEVAVRKKAVAQRVNRMGKFILLYKGDFSWDECLSLYRGKDIIEKGFDFLKNDIESLPLNVQKETTLKGSLFVNFLALIIRMRLLNLMREKGLIERYSIGGLLLELEKLKKIELSDGETFTSELTKKQKEILEKLGLCA
jgi:transposase